MEPAHYSQHHTIRGEKRSTATSNKTTEGKAMDKDKVKGAMDDAAGRVKRQVGEWTGDTNKQVEGAAQQIKGKAEKASGQVKDAVRDATDEARRERERLEANHEKEREHAHGSQRH
jgi:uncharacterized protein YjbJ (UPF0337 family)